MSNTNLIPNAATLLEFANLQVAAEALYGQQDAIPDWQNRTNIFNDNLVDIGLLNDGNNRTSKFTKAQAAEFAKNWEIVSHIANTGTGFSGTLKEGDLVISFRSTEFIDDAVRDNRATNTFEIKEKGWAFGQISDMEKWFQSLRNDGLIPKGKQVSVTGYSLGGHLATVLNTFADRAA